MVNADQVKEHIVRHLKWDSSLKGSRIKVDYVGRTAILTGTVPNLIAHEAAQRAAQSIPGVDSVENRLTVAYDHNHPNKTDEALQSDIQNVLKCAAAINAEKIKVNVQDGIVNLEGTVDAFWKKDRVEDLVSSVDGVLKIDNRVRVTPSEKVPDQSVRQDIIAALGRMEEPGLDKLSVEVKDGVVALSGRVPTWTAYFDVEDTARFTAGVVDVKNNLEIE
jgi:osmotically-inducible protein OsmY